MYRYFEAFLLTVLILGARANTMTTTPEPTTDEQLSTTINGETTAATSQQQSTDSSDQITTSTTNYVYLSATTPSETTTSSVSSTTPNPLIISSQTITPSPPTTQSTLPRDMTLISSSTPTATITTVLPTVNPSTITPLGLNTTLTSVTTPGSMIISNEATTPSPPTIRPTLLSDTTLTISSSTPTASITTALPTVNPSTATPSQITTTLTSTSTGPMLISSEITTLPPNPISIFIPTASITTMLPTVNPSTTTSSRVITTSTSNTTLGSAIISSEATTSLPPTTRPASLSDTTVISSSTPTASITTALPTVNPSTITPFGVNTTLTSFTTPGPLIISSETTTSLPPTTRPTTLSDTTLTISNSTPTQSITSALPTVNPSTATPSQIATTLTPTTTPGPIIISSEITTLPLTTRPTLLSDTTLISSFTPTASITTALPTVNPSTAMPSQITTTLTPTTTLGPMIISSETTTPLPPTTRPTTLSDTTLTRPISNSTSTQSITTALPTVNPSTATPSQITTTLTSTTTPGPTIISSETTTLSPTIRPTLLSDTTLTISSSTPTATITTALPTVNPSTMTRSRVITTMIYITTPGPLIISSQTTTLPPTTRPTSLSDITLTISSSTPTESITTVLPTVNPITTSGPLIISSEATISLPLTTRSTSLSDTTFIASSQPTTHMLTVLPTLNLSITMSSQITPILTSPTTTTTTTPLPATTRSASPRDTPFISGFSWITVIPTTMPTVNLSTTTPSRTTTTLASTTATRPQITNETTTLSQPSTQSNQPRSFSIPKIISNTSKLIGILAGGGMLNFSADNPDFINLLGAYFIPINVGNSKETLFGHAYERQPLRKRRSPGSSISILTPKAPENCSCAGQHFNLTFEFASPSINSSTDFVYTFVDNPILTDIQPRIQYISGGTLMTVVGFNLDGVFDPVLKINITIVYRTNDTTDYKQYTQSPCLRNSIQLVYQLPVFDIVPPELRSFQNSTTPGPRKTSTGQQTSDDGNITMYMNLGFKLDDFHKYDDIGISLPNISISFVSPRIIPIDGLVDYYPSNGESIKIQGWALNRLAIENYRTTVGFNNCTISSVDSNRLQCSPQPYPAAGSEPLYCGKYKDENVFVVLVYIGINKEFFSHCVHYVYPSGHLAIILGTVLGGVGCSVLLVLVCCIAVKIRKSRERQERQRLHSDDFDLIETRSDVAESEQENYNNCYQKTLQQDAAQNGYQTTLQQDAAPRPVRKSFGPLVRPNNDMFNSEASPRNPGAQESSNSGYRRNNPLRDMGCTSGNYSKAIPKSTSPVDAPPKKSTDPSADSEAIPASILKQQLGMEIPLVERNVLVPLNDNNRDVPLKFLGDSGTVVSLNEDKDLRGLISSRSPMGDDYSRTLQTNPTPQLISFSRDSLFTPPGHPHTRYMPESRTRSIYPAGSTPPSVVPSRIRTIYAIDENIRSDDVLDEMHVSQNSPKVSSKNNASSGNASERHYPQLFGANQERSRLRTIYPQGQVPYIDYQYAKDLTAFQDGDGESHDYSAQTISKSKQNPIYNGSTQAGQTPSLVKSRGGTIYIEGEHPYS